MITLIFEEVPKHYQKDIIKDTLSRNQRGTVICFKSISSDDWFILYNVHDTDSVWSIDFN